MWRRRNDRAGPSGMQLAPPPAMGSELPEDDAGKHQYCYCWWRSAPEFDERGRARRELYPTKARELSILRPRARVLMEMERLDLVAHESLDDLSHKLLSYRAGDFWVPTGGISKEETNIPPVVTILLVGFAGSGKSSLVNLMYSVLGRSGLIPFAHTTSSSGKDGRTKCLEEHNVLRSPRSGFCVFDSKGLEYSRVQEGIEEVGEWVEEGVWHHQVCGRAGKESDDEGSSHGTRKYLRRRVNCAMVVANLSEIYKSYKAGNKMPLEATRELFLAPSLRISDEKPMLVLTHGDELTTEERIEGRLKLCEFLGTSETTGVYDIACLNEYGLLVDAFDPVTAYGVAELVYRAVMLSDRNHPPKRSVKEWILCVMSWVLWCLSAFFAFLSYCCSKFASKDRKFKLM